MQTVVSVKTQEILVRRPSESSPTPKGDPRARAILERAERLGDGDAIIDVVVGVGQVCVHRQRALLVLADDGIAELATPDGGLRAGRIGARPIFRRMVHVAVLDVQRNDLRDTVLLVRGAMHGESHEFIDEECEFEIARARLTIRIYLRAVIDKRVTQRRAC